jgi:hypothetical protein
MASKNAKIENIKTVIRRQLVKAGVYSPELAYQVELAASDIILYRKLRDTALNEETEVIVTEFSRENRPREKINPIFDAMKKQADVVRKDLRALYMNRELKRQEEVASADERDPINDLMEKLNNMGTDDDE